MRLIKELFLFGIKQIINDGILFMLLPAPIMVGLVFKYAVPIFNTILEDRFSFSLLPWYGLMDGVLICLTPMFTAMVSAFLLLEERDEGISAFYQITPANGYLYLSARIGVPIIGALVMTVVAMLLFGISGLTITVIILGSIISSLTSVSLAMMVVSFAGNRVEGLAFSKLMGVSLLGLILVWFIAKPVCYIVAFLPSFWIGRLLVDGANLPNIAFGVIWCVIWIAVFTKKFLRRIG